jgi:hypothetical protein
MESFSVVYRNFGHWDISNREHGRLFRIRGGPGKYKVMDEREKPYPATIFKTVGACMQFITDELMYELIVAKGQAPIEIENWNI